MIDYLLFLSPIVVLSAAPALLFAILTPGGHARQCGTRRSGVTSLSIFYREPSPHDKIYRDLAFLYAL